MGRRNRRPRSRARPSPSWSGGRASVLASRPSIRTSHFSHPDQFAEDQPGAVRVEQPQAKRLPNQLAVVLAEGRLSVSQSSRSIAALAKTLVSLLWSLGLVPRGRGGTRKSDGLGFNSVIFGPRIKGPMLGGRGMALSGRMDTVWAGAVKPKVHHKGGGGSGSPVNTRRCIEKLSRCQSHGWQLA
jgi:hypothetical protein